MARFLPAAVSALLALAGLPAIAASPDAADLSVAGLGGGSVEASGLDDLSASGLSPSGDDADRAARRGRSGKSSKAKARSSGSRSSNAKARSGASASGNRTVMRAPTNRATPATVRAAPARSGQGERSATAQQRSSQQRSSAQHSSAQRSAGQNSSSAALRPSSTRSGGGDAHRNASGQRSSSSSERARTERRSGSNAQRAGVGPRAANKVELGRGNRGDARQGGNHDRAKVHHNRAKANHNRAKANHNRAKAARNAQARHRHVVHHRAGVPPRWSPRYHRYHLRGVSTWHPRYWTAGVFVYNPPPRAHRVVVVDDSGNRVKGATKPKRAVNRNNSFSIGLRSGSYMSGYDNGGGYGDLGLGLAMRYRPHESVGLELAWQHHNDSWDENTERAQDPLSASVELFAFPWTRVSPYALLGVTLTPRAADDTYANGAGVQQYQAADALFGPHAGLGLEFAIGKKTSLNFDGRYIGYVDVQPGDDALPGAFQGNMGLNFHF